MRSPPGDLAPERLVDAVAAGWGLTPGALEYVAEGGGSHHWVLADGRGGRHFVTVDDLDDKDWMADTRAGVLAGLERALGTAAALRDTARLGFVLAPVACREGRPLRRIDDRYAVSVFPFVDGRSYPFGPYTDIQLRDRVLEMIAELHRSTPAVEHRAPQHVLCYGGQRDLAAFLADPGRPWVGGPFAGSARDLLAPRARELAALVAAFGQLAAEAAARRHPQVVTHGEPHPANIMSAGDRLLLIDWDTTALAPPERDLSVVASAPDGLDRYERATGRAVDPALLTLYQLRWYLDDLASAVRLFRNPHSSTADTVRWWQGIGPQLEQLTLWLERVTRP